MQYTPLALILIATLLASQAFAAPTQGKLIVEFHGFDNDDGELGASIVDRADLFLADYRKSLRHVRARINGGRVTWIIDNLPFGSYAIACYHDENNNRRYDLNSLGIPREDYGFSNNVRGLFAPPSYAEARFDFERNGQVIRIEVEDYPG